MPNDGKAARYISYVRLKFCTLGSVRFIQPVWFLVRYKNIQRDDLPSDILTHRNVV